jgi:hypothetical protein
MDYCLPYITDDLEEKSEPLDKVYLTVSDAGVQKADKKEFQLSPKSILKILFYLLQNPHA